MTFKKKFQQYFEFVMVLSLLVFLVHVLAC